MYLCQLCAAGVEAKLINIHTGTNILLLQSYYSFNSISTLSRYIWTSSFCNLQHRSGHIFISFSFFRHVFKLTVPCDPLSFQMNRPIQVKPADSESRGGKRHLSPPRNTAQTTTSQQCTQPKMSALMTHLVSGPYLNTCIPCNEWKCWVFEHLKVAAPESRQYGLII